jgi:hypothetical protein
VTATGLGLIFQVRTVRAAGSTWILLLTGLLLPVLAVTARVVVLLVMAGRAGAGTAAGGEWRDEHDPPAGAAADEPPATREPATAGTLRRLSLLTTSVQRREFLAGTALNWSYVAGAGFLAWSLLTTLGPGWG